MANLTASRISAEPVRRVRVFQSRTYLSCDTGAREVERYRLVLDADRYAADSTRSPAGRRRRTARLELEAFVDAVRTRGHSCTSTGGRRGARSNWRTAFANAIDASPSPRER